MTERISNMARRAGQLLHTVMACAVMTQLYAMGTPERDRGPSGELGCVVGTDGIRQSHLSRDGPPTALPSNMTVKIEEASSAVRMGNVLRCVRRSCAWFPVF
ncbi:hypothetical protein JCM10908_000975 [Rhodotorula pacifica]|uniref:uncharacterized protein n=1 Tax=Rhodotorula pacifica TaxID=1495444 RepID=UPI00317FB16A